MNKLIGMVNGETKIVCAYFDMDKLEFISKDQLIKRFPNPHDYYLRYDFYVSATNEHRILWAYSKRHFMLADMKREVSKISHKPQ